VSKLSNTRITGEKFSHKQMNTTLPPKYYMLRVEGKGFPTKEHLTRDAATQEAERLVAKENLPVDLLVCESRCVPRPGPEPTENILARLANSTDSGDVIDVAMGRIMDLQDLVDEAYEILKLRNTDEWEAKALTVEQDIKEFRKNAQPFVTLD